MTAAAGKVFGTIGALSAFPARLASREAARHGCRLSRGVNRRTTHVVVGRNLLARSTPADIAGRIDAARTGGRQLLSETGFLRLLGLASAPDNSTLSRQAVLDQSRLQAEDFDRLALFDAFEHDAEPFSFRDVILARKYAGLIAGGATWVAVARSIHRFGPVASLTARSLHAAGPDSIYLQHRDGLSEIDGQLLFDLGPEDDAAFEDGFADAEAAEAEGRHDEAVSLYRRCLAIDPTDAVAAFNCANCLRALGREVEAAHDYMRAVKLDADFVEAWFNLAGLMTERGRVDTARRYLARAISIDGTYADPVFNLAKLEFDAGHATEARRWWSRYLELDPASQWGRAAARGIQLIDLQAARIKAG